MNIHRFLITALAVLLFAVASASAQTTTVNSELVARIFLEKEIAYFTGDFGSSVGGEWEYGEFTMLPDGRFTALKLNGDVVPIDPNSPLAGLPYPVQGIRQYFNFYVSAYASDGSFIGYGDFYAQVLKKKDPIVVILSPASTQMSVRFGLPTGVDTNDLVLELNDGSAWGYDSNAGGFTFWYDRLGASAYRVINQRTGVVYAVGLLKPFDDTPSSPKGESIVSIVYPGNVVEVPLDGDKYSFYRTGQTLDGNIDTDGLVGIPAKVYMVRMGSKALSVYASGLGKGRMLIKQWVAEGPLPVIADIDMDFDPENGSASGSAYVPAGYEKVIVEIVGSEDRDGFGVWFSAFDNYDGRG